jgi:hypothetical protein
MSLYIEWLNQIKEKSNESWLTDSQKKIYNLILNKWQAQPFICLYGKQGVGKSFLAHILAKEHNYFYSQEINSVPSHIAQVILDDAHYDRFIRTEALKREIGRVILISTNPAFEEAMPKIELEINDKDICQFQASLSKYCNISFLYTIPEGNSFTEILLREIVARGEKGHVN